MGELELLFCLLCQQSPCLIEQQSYLFPSHTFAPAVAAHLVVLNSHCQIQFQVSFDVPSPVSACSGSVHISCNSFLCLSFISSLLIHVGLLLVVFAFLLTQDRLLLSLEEVIMNPSSHKDHYPTGVFHGRSKVPEQPEVCSLKLRGVILMFVFHHPQMVIHKMHQKWLVVQKVCHKRLCSTKQFFRSKSNREITFQ